MQIYFNCLCRRIEWWHTIQTIQGSSGSYKKQNTIRKMQEVIRDGALRLMTSETTCDVIINCQGRRLMAHKVMLSIASPLLQELLLADQSETSVLVLPDVAANTMAYILDYVYTGSVLLHPTVLTDFLSAANLLKLKIQDFPPADLIPSQVNTPQNYSNKFYNTTTHKTEVIFPKKPTHCDEYKNNLSECGPECYHNPPIYPQTFKNSVDEKLCDFKLTEKRLKFTPIILQDDRNPGLNNGIKPSEMPNNLDLSNSVSKKKTNRKIPNLMPITRSQFSAFKARKGLYNRVFPSPWCPRIIPVTGDPRQSLVPPTVSPLIISNGTLPSVETTKENIETPEDHNDKNNNLQRVPYNSPNPINSASSPTISPIYQSIDNNALNLHQYNVTAVENQTKLYELTTPQRSEVNNNTSVIVTTGSEYQNPRTSDSTYSSAESSNSSCDAKSGEDCVKISDEDNGKEDGDLSDRKQKRYECEDCGKQFSQLRNYKYHRSVHEGTKEFAARCPECGKVFNDRGYLSSHLKIHRDRKEYGCPHCPKRFNQRVAYNMHLRIHTGVKPHVCPTCGKGFSRKMLLKQHQRVHTGERPYQCPECGKSFADRSNMSLHARLHTGVKPYACNLCPKSFTKKHHLKTHMNYHTGLKPYACQKCGLTFSQSSNMRTHYKKCIQKDSSVDVSSTVTVNNCI